MVCSDQWALSFPTLLASSSGEGKLFVQQMLQTCLVFRWKKVALLNIAIPAIAFSLSIFIPESPIFLVKIGRDKDAKKSLSRLISHVERLAYVV